MKGPRIRLTYVVSHPIQYQAPLFRGLSSMPHLDFRALFGSDFGVTPSFDPGFGRQVDFGIPLLDGYKSAFLPRGASRPSIDRFTGLRLPLTERFFKGTPPDVVIIHGWRTLLMWQAAAACRSKGIPYMIRAETPELPGFHPGFSLQRLARDIAVRRLLSGAAAVLSLGSANDRFYRRMGVSPLSIKRVPYFVDNRSVQEAAARGAASRAQIRQANGIPQDARLLIGVGKLISRKRPDWIVQLLPDLAADIHLLWVGSGELEADLRSRISRLGLQSRVHLTGFAQPSVAWELMGAADLFVCPSVSEPWGLVINEAVAAGRPAVVTNQCGAAEDLICDGITGSVLTPEDRAGWIAAMERWSRRDAINVRTRSIMRERSSAHGLDVAVSAIAMTACETAKLRRSEIL